MTGRKPITKRGEMRNLSIDLDLNVQTPEQVAQVLEQLACVFDRAADAYNESRSELQGAWGDANAGLVWEHLAKRMEGTSGLLRLQAGRCAHNCHRYV